MRFDTVTFVLEILNFLVLMGLLKHFLYKPVLAALAERRRESREALDSAARDREAAEALKAEYGQRLSHWEAERAGRVRAQEEALAAERERKLAEVRAAAEDEKARLAACRDRELEALKREIGNRAGADALGFAGTLLKRLASPALDRELLRVFREDLAGLSGPDLDTLRAAAAGCGGQAVLSTAFPVEAELTDALVAELQARLGAPLACAVTVDPALIGGLRLVIGDRSLDLDLRDELAYFHDRFLNGGF